MLHAPIGTYFGKGIVLGSGQTRTGLNDRVRAGLRDLGISKNIFGEYFKMSELIHYPIMY